MGKREKTDNFTPHDQAVIRERAAKAGTHLRHCHLCPRKCGVNRFSDQVGNLVCDAQGIAVRGLLVRYMVMPGMAGEAEKNHALSCR